MKSTLSVTTDELIFEAGERKPDDSLLLLLEGIGGLDADEKHVITEIVEGILLKHQAFESELGEFCHYICRA